MTRTRRAADWATESKMKADSAKLTGNSAYGSVIMDKTRFRNVRYVQGKQEAKFEVDKTLFWSLAELGNDMYEIEMGKPQIKLDLPVQIGYFILQYAKLCMLEFHYDFLDRFIDRSDYQKLYMDTDSSYISISLESLDDLVKPSMKKTFNDAIYGHCDDSNYLPDDVSHFLPRRCCEEHATYDARTPGLFKLEFSGDVAVGLCSKMFAVEDRASANEKHSSKGVGHYALTKQCKEREMSVTELYKSILDGGRTLY